MSYVHIYGYARAARTAPASAAWGFVDRSLATFRHRIFVDRETMTKLYYPCAIETRPQHVLLLVRSRSVLVRHNPEMAAGS